MVEESGLLASTTTNPVLGHAFASKCIQREIDQREINQLKGSLQLLKEKNNRLEQQICTLKTTLAAAKYEDSDASSSDDECEGSNNELASLRDSVLRLQNELDAVETQHAQTNVSTLCSQCKTLNVEQRAPIEMETETEAKKRDLLQQLQEGKQALQVVKNKISQTIAKNKKTKTNFTKDLNAAIANLGSSAELPDGFGKNVIDSLTANDPNVRARLQKWVTKQLVKFLCKPSSVAVIDTQMNKAKTLHNTLKEVRSLDDSALDLYLEEDEERYEALILSLLEVMNIHKIDDGATKKSKKKENTLSEGEKKEEDVQKHRAFLQTLLANRGIALNLRRWLAGRGVLKEIKSVPTTIKSRLQNHPEKMQSSHQGKQEIEVGGDHYVAKFAEVKESTDINLLDQCLILATESDQQLMERLDRIWYSSKLNCQLSRSSPIYQAVLLRLEIEHCISRDVDGALTVSISTSETTKWISATLAMEGIHPKLLRCGIQFEHYNFLTYTGVATLVKQANKFLKHESNVVDIQEQISDITRDVI